MGECKPASDADGNPLAKPATVIPIGFQDAFAVHNRTDPEKNEVYIDQSPFILRTTSDQWNYK